MEGTITIAQTTSTNDDITNVIITFRSTSEQVNSSHCHISSLEVYRGRKQAIEISYEGFFLSENGTIKVYYTHKEIIMKPPITLTSLLHRFTYISWSTVLKSTWVNSIA